METKYSLFEDREFVVDLLPPNSHSEEMRRAINNVFLTQSLHVLHKDRVQEIYKRNPTEALVCATYSKCYGEIHSGQKSGLLTLTSPVIQDALKLFDFSVSIYDFNDQTRLHHMMKQEDDTLSSFMYVLFFLIEGLMLPRLDGNGEKINRFEAFNLLIGIDERPKRHTYHAILSQKKMPMITSYKEFEALPSYSGWYAMKSCSFEMDFDYFIYDALEFIELEFITDDVRTMLRMPMKDYGITL